MHCAALLSADTPSLRDGQSIAEACAALSAHGAETLPVTDAAGRYLGLFALADLLALVVPRIALAGDMKANLRFVADDPALLRTRFAEIAARPLGEWCSRAAATVTPDTPAIEALRLFCRGQLVVPVVEESGQLLGVLRAGDAIRAITAGAVTPDTLTPDAIT